MGVPQTSIKYKKYIGERFPLKVFGVYSGSLYFVSYSFGNVLPAAGEVRLIHAVLGFAVIFLFFIQLRIFDEHKDFESDRIEHPERMLSKGEITLEELRRILYAAIILELTINLFLGITQLVIWGVAFIWSLLMLKEFFCPDFLKGKPSLYVFSHQLVMPIICLYALSGRIDVSLLDRQSAVLVLVFMSGCICLTMSMEAARKMKPVLTGEQVPAKMPHSRNKVLGFLPCMLLSVYGWTVLMLISVFNHTGMILNTSCVILFAFYVYKAAVLYNTPETSKIKAFKGINMVLVFGTFIHFGLNFSFI